MIVTWNLTGVVNSITEKYLMISYDDIYSIQYFSVNLPAYWRRFGEDGRKFKNTIRFDYNALTTSRLFIKFN